MCTSRHSNAPLFPWSQVLILWVGFVLRTWHLGAASFWIDEVVTANRVHRPLINSLGSIVGAGNQVPFYYLLLRGFPTSNELLLRLPSAFAGTLSIALIMLIAAHLYHDHRLTLLSGALLAFNPLHIGLSRMARSYALLIVLSLLASYLFIQLLGNNQSRPKWIVFVLSSAAAYLTHYFGLILLFAQFAFLLLSQYVPSHFKRHWLVAQCTAIAPFLLWFLPVVIIDLFRPGQLIGKGVAWIPAPHWSDLPLTFGNLAVGYDGSSRLFIPGFLAAMILLITGWFYTLRRADTECSWNLYWFALAVPLPLVAFLASPIKSLYVDRYFSIGLPAILLFIVYGWKHFPYPALGRVLVMIILMTGAGASSAALQPGHIEKADWRDLAAYLQKVYRPGDGILFQADHLREPLEYYFGTGSIQVLTLSEKDALDFSELHRLWVVYPNPYIDVHRQGALPDFDPFTPGAGPMGDWLIAHRTAIIAQHDFNGIKLFLILTEKL